MGRKLYTVDQNHYQFDSVLTFGCKILQTVRLDRRFRMIGTEVKGTPVLVLSLFLFCDCVHGQPHEDLQLIGNG